ncbi:hypothetical protein HBI04_051810 [Parastagonospora nodorum]|nr:hypothetical protein HBH49_171960 [Parastagonospora nodorum]KAH4243474.1 hypothetical protein HBI05_084240 [Parastagonospora nodorum]KAH4243721.1 hypothetical protein HBI06_009240 [Parastagonospora nodorum]KAH4262610.1 hypothetical protein HBI03_110300 [Parastagonospora nodorum]KAH4281023.1 hypothetical protein HBI04_051810 [Parastagonospora nodorum]
MQLIYFLVVPLVSARVIGTTQQIPIPGHVAEDVVKHIAQEESALAIGVHFTTSYAVAAARYKNGTTRTLVKVAADADYIDLLSRWSQGQHDLKNQDCHVQSRHSSVPKEVSRRYRCTMRSLQRSSRRMLGLPASRDAAILSDFMSRVRSDLQAEILAPVTSIAPAFPRLSHSQKEDVREALSYAGLTSSRLRTSHAGTIIYQDANAAYAGLGHGLCESQSSRSDCQSPANDQSVLYFNFDNSSFSVGAMTLKSAFQEQRTYVYGSDTTLGWWDLPVYEIPRAKYWARIHEMILNVLAPMSLPPNRIVLLGEHGADEEFKEVVKAATWEKFDFDVELMLQTVKKEDVGSLAARGAAELGWRDEEFNRESVSRRRDAEEANEL